MSDSFDDEISALYRDASQDSPPAHLDDAILAMAKREAQSKPKAVSPFSGQWTLPFSLAAVIVLSVSVVTLVEKEAPPTQVGSVDSLSPPQENLAPRPRKDTVLVEKLTEEKASPAVEFADKLRKKELPREQPIESAPRLVLNKPAPPPSVAPKRKAEMKTEAKPGRSSTADVSAVAGKVSPAAPAVVAQSVDAGKSADAEKPAKRVSSEAADALSEAAQSAEPMVGLSAGQNQRLAPSAITPSPAPQSSVSERRLTTSTAHLFSSAQNKAPLCESLTASHCLQAPDCTLVRDRGAQDYQCREAANRCEQNFVQFNALDKDSGKALCESKPGCRFIPGDCQCPQGQDCDCRGRNPPQCEQK